MRLYRKLSLLHSVCVVCNVVSKFANTHSASAPSPEDAVKHDKCVVKSPPSQTAAWLPGPGPGCWWVFLSKLAGEWPLLMAPAGLGRAGAHVGNAERVTGGVRVVLSTDQPRSTRHHIVQ